MVQSDATTFCFATRHTRLAGPMGDHLAVFGHIPLQHFIALVDQTDVLSDMRVGPVRHFLHGKEKAENLPLSPFVDLWISALHLPAFNP